MLFRDIVNYLKKHYQPITYHSIGNYLCMNYDAVKTLYPLAHFTQTDIYFMQYVVIDSTLIIDNFFYQGVVQNYNFYATRTTYYIKNPKCRTAYKEITKREYLYFKKLSQQQKEFSVKPTKQQLSLF